LPLVLHGVTMSVRGREKVGICGRTGAGKSSLIVALLRVCEGTGTGSISIDGRDIRAVPLKDLRTHVSLIPQEPFLFSTTIRQNLDPFEE
jgi:ATP-binding cassette subfamily C (CFTR/MRP) protein 1